jgi:hypothetical protein
MDIFNRYFDDQLLLRKKEWSDEYARAMGDMDLNQSVKNVISDCDQIAAAALNRFDQFKTVIGTLQGDTVAAMKMSIAYDGLIKMSEDGTKGKLNQMDEQVALYNRALLNKAVKPVVDKVHLHHSQSIILKSPSADECRPLRNARTLATLLS